MNTICSSPDPEDLDRERALSLPPEGRLRYFRTIRVKHPRVIQVLRDLDLMTSPDTGTSIALLLGPTGVGKSTIVQGFKRNILDASKQEMANDPGLIPVISVEAPATGERGFSWRIFYQRLGEALQEPLLLRKQETLVRNGRTVIKPVTTGPTVAALQSSVEKALIHRKTRIVIVDEAVHLLRNLGGNSLENHLDALKYLSNESGAKLVLAGSYDLHGLMDLSGQIARRCSVLHMQRYQPGVDGDVLAFNKVLQKFAKHFPLEGAEALNAEGLAGELLEACIGCVGILKETLVRALAIALRDGTKWRNAFLDAALLTPAQVRVIHQEVLEGEAHLSGTICGTGSFQDAKREIKACEVRVKGVA